MSIQPLIEHFESFIPMKAEERMLFEGRAAKRKVKRRQMILQEGFVCKHFTLVHRG